MKANRKRAILVGVFFILAAAASIIGLLLYNPILQGPDYLLKGSEHANQVVLGAVFELILVCSAVGTSITLFPLLRKQNETIALGYVCFRFLEAIIITVGVISVLSLLSLSQEYAAAGAPNDSSYQITGTLLKAVHDWTFMLGPNFMLGVNTLMCSYLLFASRLVPRFISILGMTGAVLIFIAAILELFGIILQLSTWGALLAIPVALYEMILAVWLIVKGFNNPPAASNTIRSPQQQ